MCIIVNSMQFLYVAFSHNDDCSNSANCPQSDLFAPLSQPEAEELRPGLKMGGGWLVFCTHRLVFYTHWLVLCKHRLVSRLP